MNTQQAALVIIFNHKYNGNIPVLYELYNRRFEAIWFIVPFYEEDDALKKYNIIPVYESSYRYEGYIAQAYDKLKSLAVDHYIFIGDDLVLHPVINQENYGDYFRVGNEQSFSTEICKINAPFGRYSWAYERIYANIQCFCTEEKFVNFRKEIPAPEEAFSIAKEKGFEGFRIRKRDYRRNSGPKGLMRDIICKAKTIPAELPYPTFGGYSDLLVIHQASLQKFSHYCGIFAAMGLFAEIAIPTAMVLACYALVTLDETKYERGDIWGMDKKRQFCEKYDYSLNRLLNEWDDKMLFIHPVKLSEWNGGQEG